MENTERLIMERELQETQKSIPAGDTNATPLMNYVSTKSPASPSKVLIITPEQIAKLGLTQQIKNVVASQVASKALHKNRPRVTKLKIIDDAPSNSSNKDAAKLEVNTGTKSQKDESNKKEAVRGSFTASNVNEFENTTKNPKEKQEITMNTENRENLKQPKKKEADITEEQGVGNKNLLEDNVIVEQEKKGKLVETTKSSDIATETGAKMIPKSLNSTLTNQVISSIKNKLLSMLETGVTSAHKPSTSVNDTKPVYNTELVTNSKKITKKRKQSNCNPLKASKTIVSSAEILSKSENISSKTNTCPTSKTNLHEKNNTLALTNDSAETIASNLDVDLFKKDVSNSLTEIKTNKTAVKRRLGKVQPNITKNVKITKRNREQASILRTPEPEDTNCTTSSVVVESSNDIKNTNLAKETLEPSGETRAHKIHVLSNEQISLPHTYIEQMLKENFNQKINIYNPTLKRSISNDSSSTKLNSGLEQDKITNISGEPNLVNLLSKDVPNASCENENNDSPAASDNVSLTSKNLSGTNQSTLKISGTADQQNILLINTVDFGSLEPDSIIKEIPTKEDVNISNQNSAQDSIFNRLLKKDDIEGLISNEQSINTVANTSIVTSKVERIETIHPHNQEKFTTEKCLVVTKQSSQVALKSSTLVVQAITSDMPVSAVTLDVNPSEKMKNVREILNISQLDKDSESKDKSYLSEPKLREETVISVQVTTPNISATASKQNIIQSQKIQNVAETLKAIKSHEKTVEETASGVAVTAITQDVSQPQKIKTKEKSHPSDETVIAVTQAITKPEKTESVKSLKTSEPNRNSEIKEKPNTSDPETATMQSTCQLQNMKNTEILKTSNSDKNLEINEKMYIRRLPPIINVLSKPEFPESAIHKLEETTKPSSGSTSTQISKKEELLGSVQNLEHPNKVERITATNERGRNTVEDKSSRDHPKTKNVLQKPEIPVSKKLEFVDSELMKEDVDVPLSSIPIKANPLSEIHLEDCLEESVNHTEKNEHIFEGEEVACSAMPRKQVTLTPKKRGRKKKSEMIVKEEPEFRPRIPTFEVSASKRSGRKRQVVDYSALAEGVDFDEVKPKKPKKEKVKNENSTGGVLKIDPSIVDSSTDKSLLSLENEILSNEKAQEVASMDNEVNSFLSLDNATDIETTTEKQREHEITLIRIEDEYTSEEDVGVLKRKISQKLTKEGFKRKRGRPRGSTKSQNNLANKVMNSIFQHINTPTKSNENKEAEEQTISHNNGTLDNVQQDLGDAQSQSIVDLKNEPITCGVCYAELEKNVWQYHKQRKHNNLTWRLGEAPLDLNDQKLVVTILTDLYKRKKPLFCEFCGQSKKSVMGFLSHKSVCQKSSEEIQSMRIKCEFCERAVMPVSMSAHLKFCRVLNLENTMQEYQKPEVIQETPSTSKRKAASKAEKLIKVFKDDGTFELVSENKPKNTQKWYVNFDFHPTFFGKRWIQHQITQNGRAKCIFAECGFESSDAVEMANHIWKCNRKPTEGYTCKFCMSTHTTEDDIVEHMQQNHDKAHGVLSLLDEENEDNSIEKEEELVDDGIRDYKECKPKLPPKTNLMHGIKFLLLNRLCAPTTGVKYSPAFDWTLKFCQENLSTQNLYPNWRINRMCYEKLSPDLVIKYLPRVRFSACTARIETKKFVDPLKLDYDWKRYKLFESEKLHNGTSIIFCGGSIFSMAWLPTPYDEKHCEQILAVSTDSSMDKEYRLNDVYREASLIQFWNCGLLTNEEDIDDKPRLQFCIAHDYGPAWCLEWCPSGCYDMEQNENTDCLQRLGVLAVGCADGHIYIYSINLPDQTSNKILKTKPVLKLVLDSVAEETVSGIEAHVTKISWSKVSGHRFLIAGYANGLVAIYDLSSTSVLLRVGYDQNDVEMLMPYRTFSAHYHAITALSVYHLNDGRRWLMTGSVDRSIKYWDLENPTVPITNFMKLIVTDGVWLNHWLSTVQTFDDSCGGGLTYTAAHQLRNFESETTSIMHSNSRVSAITGNDWVNGFVQGNIVGEVKGFFPHQMFYSMDSDKSSRIKKVILGYARLVEKNLNIQERIREEQEKLKHVNNKPAIPVDGDTMIKTKNFNINVDYAKPEPGTYKEAEEKYGLVFCDMRVNCIKEFPANIDSYFKSNKVNKLYASRPNIYPMESINKVVFNPNRGSFLHLATGYQVGFVRISCLRFLNR